jgi:hypothetical protein
MSGAADNRQSGQLIELGAGLCSTATVEDAYRGLPRHGELRLAAFPQAIAATVRLLEDSGFIAIEVSGAENRGGARMIRAFKGKNGPCYDTGRTARYTGVALAAVDDDMHLLFRDGDQAPVCEKTARLYALPPYGGLITISDGAPELLARYDTEPAPFDCDTWEDDLARAAASLPAAVAETAREPLLYPGPFRCLILDDGTMLRRGVVSCVPSAAVPALVGTDGCLPAPVSAGGEEAAAAPSFQTQYAALGGRLFAEELDPRSVLSAPTVDLDALATVTPSLAQRLTACIRDGRDFMMLTGSDPADDYGCCPADDVGEANRLVAAGVLSSVCQPQPADACPVTVYAFGGELRTIDGSLRFIQDAGLRAEVRGRLNARGGGGLIVLRYALLAFVLLTVALGAQQLLQPPPAGDIAESLGVTAERVTVVGLFRSSRRCPFCLGMEAHAQATLKDHFSGELMRGDVVFRDINTDLPENRYLRGHLDLFTSSIVLVEVAGGKAVRVHLVRGAWERTDDPVGFSQMLASELRRFMEAADD